MPLEKNLLEHKLTASSSRVFNCLAHTRHLDKIGIASPRFFKNDHLNRAVFLKDAVDPVDREALQSTVGKVGTKIYAPYDHGDVYAGGVSVFMREPHFNDILFENFYLSKDLNDEDAEHDRRILRALDTLPALDPFLLKDRLISEDITVNDHYLAIEAHEWNAIKIHIRDKIVPMVTIAFGEGDIADESKIRQLTEQIWEAKDLKNVLPLIKALRIPEDRATDVFYSWKGIAFFEYQYVRSVDRIRQLGTWITKYSDPLDFVPAPRQRAQAEMRENIIRSTKERWKSSVAIFDAYNHSYDELFRRMGSPQPFVEFMGAASENFWFLGDALSSLYHAVDIWERAVNYQTTRPLQAAPLDDLFHLLEDVLARK